MFNPRALIKLLRRASHSGYEEVVMNNHMLVQCYTVDVDGDQGFHYALVMPDEEDYRNKFFDETIIFPIKDVLSVYNGGHAELEEHRKKRKLKPSTAREEGYFSDGLLKFIYMCEGELVTTREMILPWPVNPMEPMLENIENQYYACAQRVRPGGACLRFNGLRHNLQNYATESPIIYDFIVRYNKRKIHVPIAKSMFLGMKNVDKFFITLQETRIDHIYLYAVNLTKNGIAEILWGYLLDYGKRKEESS